MRFVSSAKTSKDSQTRPNHILTDILDLHWLLTICQSQYSFRACFASCKTFASTFQSKITLFIYQTIGGSTVAHLLAIDLSFLHFDSSLHADFYLLPFTWDSSRPHTWELVGTIQHQTVRQEMCLSIYQYFYTCKYTVKMVSLIGTW